MKKLKMSKEVQDRIKGYSIVSGSIPITISIAGSDRAPADAMIEQAKVIEESIKKGKGATDAEIKDLNEYKSEAEKIYKLADELILLSPIVHLLPTQNNDAKKLKMMTMKGLSGEKVSDKQAVKNNDFLELLTNRSIEKIENLVDLSTGDIKEIKQAAGKSHISENDYFKLPILLRTLIGNEVMKLNGLA